MPRLRRVPNLAVSVGLMAASALLYEVTLTRLLSVALWYPVAYLALSTAMLGFAAAAVLLAVSSRLRAVVHLLTLSGLAFSAVTVLGYALWPVLLVDPFALAQDSGALFRLPLFVLVLTAPFFAAGIFVAHAFSIEPTKAPALYAADLVGAALGVGIFVLMVPTFGAPGTLTLSAALAACAALFNAQGRMRVLTALVAVTLIALSPRANAWLPVPITPNKALGDAAVQKRVQTSAWSVASRIDAIAQPAGLLLITDGGTAMSMAPKPTPNKAPQGLRAIAPLLSRHGTTLVIGSGGGTEVEAALNSQAPKVVALEMDPAVNQLVTDNLAWPKNPRVSLHTAEARSYLAAHPETFDAIVAFHTISNAAYANGAMSLAENYTTTREALALYLERLTPTGVLVISRPESQLGRLARTVADVWSETSSVQEHVAVVAQDGAPAFLAALVVKKQPFSATDIQVLRQHAPRIAYAPDGTGDAQAFFAGALLGEQALANPGYRAATLTPATDNRPFFNLPKAWSDVSWADARALFASGKEARARLEDAPTAQLAALALLFELALVALLLLMPALFKAQAQPKSITYFSALGAAFMMLEVMLVQSLTRLVGLPSYAMVVVLGALLLGTGCGSAWLSTRTSMTSRQAALLATMTALLSALVLPALVDVLAPAPFAWRVGAALALSFTVGLPLGLPFASQLRQTPAQYIPLAFAANGFFSVVGSVGTLILSSAVGLQATAFLAAGFYAVAAAVSSASKT